MNQLKKIDIDKADDRIVTYLESLLEKKGMGNLPPNILSDMILDLYDRFDSMLFLNVMRSMDPEKYQKFDEFLETKPGIEESSKFLHENVENLEQVLRDTMVEFESIYLGKQEQKA
jgi:hypothetical protein